jgi:RNA polymerase sigma factor (sigma-70 family)
VRAEDAHDKDGPAGSGRGVSIELLNERFRAPLLAFFRRRVNVADDAEDLLQETFVRLAKPGRLESVDNVEAYIFQIAANLVRERARRRAVRGSDQQIEIDESFADEQVFSPARILEGKDAIERIMVALKELPERVRTIFILQRFEGMTYQEVASKLDLSQSAIEKNMSRAIAHLARRMSDEV